jgi:uncharacterized protein YjbI with pentapeptide repeats
MLVLLGVALFCALTTLGSPDKLLLGADSKIEVPFANAPLSFFGFIVVTPCLLIVLATYLHVCYGYWLACERERQYLNQRLIPPIESIPTLFSFPDVVPRVLTRFVFYRLVPLVLVMITWKAWALPEIGLPLTYVTGLVTFILVLLQIHRRPYHQRQWRSLIDYAILVLVIGLMVRATFNPQSFQRPLNLFRAELPKAWLAEINMRRASADLANLQGANLQGANLQGAILWAANLQGANLRQANLQEADLGLANLQGAFLWAANLQGASLFEANLQGASLWEVNLQEANLQRASLQRVLLRRLPNKLLRATISQKARLGQARLWRAKLQEADVWLAILQANFQGANLREAKLQETDLTDTKGLTQDQVNTACVDEKTILPEGLTKPAPCR